MKKQLVFLAISSLTSGFAFAQGANFDSELDAEINQVSAARRVQAQPQQVAVAGNPSAQPIYIVNQAPTAQVQGAQVQKQPQVEIVGAPLQKSRAEQIRDARQQAEVETENRIVEKLEMSRMEDEKRRAGQLFGDAFTPAPAPAPQPVAQPVAVQPVAVQPVAVAPVPVQEVKDDATREVVREELRAALKDEKAEEPQTTKYFGGVAGIGDYPDVRNVRGNYLLGASFGTKFEDAYAVEGSFLVGNYSVDQADGGGFVNYYGYYVPRTVDTLQYTGALAVKYFFLSGMVKPVLGGVIQYSYRTFRWDQQYGYNNAGGDASSHAIDLGVVTGVDFEFSPKFALGLDFRYMFNMASRVNTGRTGSFLSSPQYGTPIEKLQYYTLGIVGRMTF